MRCPRCGAPSEVLSTRTQTASVARRRQCFNAHRFTTLEVLPAATNRRDLAAAARAATAAARRWLRDMRIRRDRRPAAVVAREHDLTEARVRQIRTLKEI